ncbi:MAG TPA: molybdenum cofactor guanylyltransferase [Thermoleophilia bacterium]|nr:molybdenum cofactor guanylyltransferase [Thermoleophilia bacterium]
MIRETERRGGGEHPTRRLRRTLSWPPYRSGVSLAVLAGGQSTRMGEDKAFALFQGGTLLEWMRDRFGRLFPHVFVVARRPDRFHDIGLPVVTDALPESGSVVGVYTAILAAPTERVLCVACDMPFVTTQFLLELADGSEGFDVFAPRHGDYVEPLCAVYGKRTLDPYRQLISSGGRRLIAIYADVRTGYLNMDDGRHGDPDKLLMNLNTPAEMHAAAARLTAEAGAGARRASLTSVS